MHSPALVNNGKRNRAPGDAIELPIARYRLVFQALEPLHLPQYSGSAWRGLMGRALRRAVCVTRQPHCAGCLLKHSCVYSTVFESPPPPGTQIMRRYTSAPHPFVLEPDCEFQSKTVEVGGHTAVGLTLFGSSNIHLPYLVHAFQTSGARGIGRGQGRFELCTVEQESYPGSGQWLTIYQPGEELAAIKPRTPKVPPMPDVIHVEFKTPLRVKREEKLVGSDLFEFHDLFRSLLRRLAHITYFHCDTPAEPDFASLSSSAKEVALKAKNLRWLEWTRYSSRQSTAMQMGGLVGEIKIDSRNLEPFWPFLWIGQWTLAGKGTSMGLGQYVIKSAASLPKR